MLNILTMKSREQAIVISIIILIAMIIGLIIGFNIQKGEDDLNFKEWSDCLNPCNNEAENCTEFMECSKVCDLKFGFAPDRSCATFQKDTRFNGE